MIQQTVAPLTTQLTTVEAVRSELGAADDPRMPSFIDQATSACEGYCGRSFARATWLETIRDLSNPLLLSYAPVLSITSVVYGQTPVEVDRYEVDLDAGLIHFHAMRSDDQWMFYRAAISVSYTAGYLLPNDPGRNLPAAVERACIEVFKGYWFGSGAGKARDPSIRSEMIEGIGSTSYLDPQATAYGLSPMAAALLMPYRRLMV